MLLAPIAEQFAYIVVDFPNWQLPMWCELQLEDVRDVVLAHDYQVRHLHVGLLTPTRFHDDPSFRELTAQCFVERCLKTAFVNHAS